MNKSILPQSSIILVILSLASGIRLLAEILLARNLPLESFGLYGLIITVVGIIQVYLANGIRVTLLRHLPIIFNESKASQFFQLIRKAFLFFVLLLITLGLLIYFSYGNIDSKTYIKIKPYLLIIFIISCLTSVLYALSDVFRSVGRIEKSTFFREFTSYLIFLIFLIVLLFFNLLSLNWILIIFSFSLFISIIWGISTFRKLNLSQLQHNNTDIGRIFTSRKLIFFWFSAELLGLFWAIRERVSIFYVSEYLTPENMAIIYVMLRACFPLYLIKNSFNSIISPVIATLFYEKKEKELNKKYQELTQLQFIYIFPVLSVLCLFGTDIIQFFLGDEYLIDSEVLAILLWLVSSSIIIGPSSVAFQMVGKPKIESFFIALSLIIIIPFNIIAIQKYGLLGIVVGVYGIILFIDILKLFYLRLKFSINSFSRVVLVKIFVLMLTLIIITLFQPFNQFINLLAVICFFMVLFMQNFSSYINEKTSN
ncbi:MATE family efflux transporter [Candidatus Pseudothioglobus singularis]|nr:MATE family efflux transporter [Candidatus Pseudothioglobus singularis]